MSRIGKQPVVIPPGVKVAVDGHVVRVEGPLGKLDMTFRPEIAVRLADDGQSVLIERRDDERMSRSLHGLTRSLIANMVEGCAKGYRKSLEIYGVGYSCQIQGSTFTVNIGKSHPAIFDVPAGLKVEVQTPQARGDTEPARFAISGADKQAVGELAACIRRARPPEPYKGKGVRYTGERVRRKAGKAFAGAGT